MTTATRIPPNRLRYLRERGRKDGGFWLTIEEVAVLMGYKSFTTVSKHENHERGISEEDLRKYARIYKVEPHQIFKGLTTKS